MTDGVNKGGSGALISVSAPRRKDSETDVTHLFENKEKRTGAANQPTPSRAHRTAREKAKRKNESLVWASGKETASGPLAVAKLRDELCSTATALRRGDQRGETPTPADKEIASEDDQKLSAHKGTRVSGPADPNEAISFIYHRAKIVMPGKAEPALVKARGGNPTGDPAPSKPQARSGRAERAIESPAVANFLSRKTNQERLAKRKARTLPLHGRMALATELRFGGFSRNAGPPKGRAQAPREDRSETPLSSAQEPPKPEISAVPDAHGAQSAPSDGNEAHASGAPASDGREKQNARDRQMPPIRHKTIKRRIVWIDDGNGGRTKAHAPIEQSPTHDGLLLTGLEVGASPQRSDAARHVATERPEPDPVRQKATKAHTEGGRVVKRPARRTANGSDKLHAVPESEGVAQFEPSAARARPADRTSVHRSRTDETPPKPERATRSRTKISRIGRAISNGLSGIDKKPRIAAELPAPRLVSPAPSGPFADFEGLSKKFHEVLGAPDDAFIKLRDENDFRGDFTIGYQSKKERKAFENLSREGQPGWTEHDMHVLASHQGISTAFVAAGKSVFNAQIAALKKEDSLIGEACKRESDAANAAKRAGKNAPPDETPLVTAFAKLTADFSDELSKNISKILSEGSTQVVYEGPRRGDGRLGVKPQKNTEAENTDFQRVDVEKLKRIYSMAHDLLEAHAPRLQMKAEAAHRVHVTKFAPSDSETPTRL
jgi:hypothetical protein